MSSTLFAAEPANCPELTGQVITSTNPNYEKARLLANYYVSKNIFPSLIVYCQTPGDVQHAIQYARCHHKPIRIRSGGHNHEGFSTAEGAVIIDVSQMKQIMIDQDKKIVIVQPGITGGELYRQLNTMGLTQAGGTCPDVGISGLILTGGMGPLLRRQGMACDSMLGLDLVDANGQLLHATRTNENKDLFWASCGGGGGNFGVVVSITLQVYPADQVTWFNIGWDWNQPVDQIITEWQRFFAKDDKRWYSNLDLWGKQFPAEKFHKQPIKVMGVFWGTPAEAKKSLASFLKIGHPASVEIESVDWMKSIELFENATGVYLTSKPEYSSPGAYAMNILPAPAVNTITTTLRDSKLPYLNMLFYTLGGAEGAIAPNDTAYFHRKAKFFFLYSTQWLKSNEASTQIAELNQLRQKLADYTIGDYIGNPDRQFKDYLTTYYGSNVHRLRCIKRKYDPTGVFQFEQGVPAAPADWQC